jgi:hypothetical protein
MIFFCNKRHLNAAVHLLPPWNKVWIVMSPNAIHVVFLVFHKNDHIKSRSSFEDLSAYKIPWTHVD